MTNPTLIQVIGATLFGLAVLHTFSTKFFERLSHTHPRHAGIWHLLGEVEVVFGFWALVLMLFMFGIRYSSSPSMMWLTCRDRSTNMSRRCTHCRH